MPRRFFSSKQRAGIGLIPVLLLILLLLASSFYPSFHALAGGTTTISASGYGQSVGAPGDTYARAQSFMVYAGRLTSFSFEFSSKGGSPGDITWEIHSNNDLLGAPGTTLASGNITPNVATMTTVTLGGSGPLLTATNLYWLVLFVTTPPAPGNYYNWLASVVSVYDQGDEAYSANGSAWIQNANSDCTSSFTTTDDTPTPTVTYTPSNTPTATPTGTLTVVPSDTPTATISPTPSNTPVPTWTLTPTPNLFVIVTLTTGQQVAVKYEITAGDAMSGALLVMLLCFSICGVFMQTRRRRLQ